MTSTILRRAFPNGSSVHINFNKRRIAMLRVLIAYTLYFNALVMIIALIIAIKKGVFEE